MVIYHPDFITQAKRLADHKQNIGRFKSPKVIDIKDIYREFSGGATDPAALRNFLVYARSQWGLFPDYVVLMGKGNYNYKGIKLSEPEYIPVAEGGGNAWKIFLPSLIPERTHIPILFHQVFLSADSLVPPFLRQRKWSTKYWISKTRKQPILAPGATGRFSKRRRYPRCQGGRFTF